VGAGRCHIGMMRLTKQLPIEINSMSKTRARKEVSLSGGPRRSSTNALGGIQRRIEDVLVIVGTMGDLKIWL